jgi:predicted nuclease with TOPRIM domain
MTRFEKDYQAIEKDWLAARGILETRQKEINKLKDELGAVKNSFRAQCILQELKKLESEYSKLDNLILI